MSRNNQGNNDNYNRRNSNNSNNNKQNRYFNNNSNNIGANKILVRTEIIFIKIGVHIFTTEMFKKRVEQVNEIAIIPLKIIVIGIKVIVIIIISMVNI